MPYAHARNTDPSTSHLAAESVAEVSRVQALVLALFHYLGDLTDAELCHNWHLMTVAGDYPPATDQNIRSRRAELVQAGRLSATGRIAYTLHGRKTTVWDITPSSSSPAGT